MTETSPNFPASSVLGYPRIGPRRELKKALEAFWAGRTSADEVEATAADLRKRTRTRLAELGLSTDVPAIPSAFSFYDHVLDATATGLLGGDVTFTLSNGGHIAGVVDPPGRRPSTGSARSAASPRRTPTPGCSARARSRAPGGSRGATGSASAAAACAPRRPPPARTPTPRWATRRARTSSAPPDPDGPRVSPGPQAG